LNRGYAHVIGRDQATIVERLQDEQIQGVAMLPMMWKALLQLPELADTDFSSLTMGIRVRVRARTSSTDSHI